MINGKLKVAGINVCFKECYVVWEAGMNYCPMKTMILQSYYERCSSSWFEMIAELIVCLTIESHRCGSRRFDRYTAGLHQAMVSTGCVTV